MIVTLGQNYRIAAEMIVIRDILLSAHGRTCSITALTIGTPMKRILTIALLAPACLCVSPVTATEHVVMQKGTLFSPESITVAPGDTVRWVRTGGNHTVTSGDDCAADGVYFDAPLNSANRAAVWTVPVSAANSTVGYFCIPHCDFFMVGTITVTGAANPADLNNDGAVNAADLAALLNNWGGSGVGDIDNSGTVNGADLAALLSAWTG